MLILLMGAGRVGHLVAKMLETTNHDVTIIELDRERAEELSTELNALIIAGDATDPRILEEANVKKAKVFGALTGRDDANILACILAKNLNPDIYTILRISNPRSREILEEVGDLKKYFDVVMCPEEIAAQYVFLNIMTPGLERVLLQPGQVELARFDVPPESPISGKPVKDIKLPDSALIILIIKKTEQGEKIIIPSGSTTIPPNSTLVVIGKNEALMKFKEMIERVVRNHKLFKPVREAKGD